MQYMATYDGIPLETLQEQLAKAQVALFPLARGEAVGQISTADNRISFVPTTMAALKQHITDLQTAIATIAGTLPARTKGIYISGGKGL